MGTGKRKLTKAPPQMRSRTTRSRGKPLPDPAENSQQLNEQLRALGLYAAPTLGDGNCLFRALSDQLYGTPSYHSKLREDICNWIETHRQRYEPFCDDERGFDVHLRCMRQQATYGGHLELSAFAHMTRRDVKVIQPGLVYVIEWAAGAEPVVEATPKASSPMASSSVDDATLDDREKRRLRRERERLAAQSHDQDDAESDAAPLKYIYVAYHDWEHFSSIRSLRGPHTGLPNVVETPAPDAPSVHTHSPAKKPPSRVKPKSEVKASTKHPPAKTRAAVLASSEPGRSSPSQVPLPASRSRSPSPSHLAPSAHSLSPFKLTPTPPPSGLPRAYRSPKRTFDESSASSLAPSESSQSAPKRPKHISRSAGNHEGAEAVDLDTPELSASGASSPASTSSLSSAPSPAPSPPPTAEPQRPKPRKLTRRQRKVLGLPKPRVAVVANTSASRTAGKIIIPGGKYKPAVKSPGDRDDGPDAEWKHNGTGRLDVRGFRELRI